MINKFNLADPVHFLALGFGSGLAPFAPGTFGTLAAIPVYYLLCMLGFTGYVIALILAIVLGIYVCGKAASDAGVHDHGAIVWDEFTGLWLTLLFAPKHWVWVVAGFILFRIFDILKPFPIGLLDRHVKGGSGIMLDDLVAGLFAMVCLQILVWCFQ